ncbi:hypothetical protein N9S64_01780 [Candidatus Pelagibacter sp.]|nr:hypothetical protein [Candidatus Pelagibacter sp.]
MSHFEQKKFIEIILDQLKKADSFDNMSVLEVGSYNVGGSIKEYFVKNDYTGVDLIEGPNVDIILNGSELKKLNKRYSIVISCECFEHAESWKDIFLSMYNVCNENGFVIFTCASRGRTEHGTLRTTNSDSPGTNDTYYRNIFKSEFQKSFNLENMFNKYGLFYNIKSSDLYFVGLKGNNYSLDISEVKKQVNQIKNKDRKIKIIRIFLSYFLNDKSYQNFIFFRRDIKSKIFKFKW